MFERWAAGENYAALSRAFKVPLTTVRRICQDPETVAMANPARAAAEKKALPGRLVHVAHRALDRLTDKTLDACSGPQAMLVAGIAIDKAQTIDSAGLRGFSPRDTLTSVMQEVDNIRSRRRELLESDGIPGDAP
jgi:hypothetical protein